MGIVLIILGALALAASGQVQEYSLEKPYNMEREDSKNNPVDPGSGCCRSNCDTADWEDHNPCYLKLTVTEDMPSPAYVYYKLENFHQNHRFYVKSRSWNQLRGDDAKEYGDVAQFCAGKILHEDNADQVAGKVSDDSYKNVINPCGLTAASLFNDKIGIAKKDEVIVHPIEPDAKHKEGVAWPRDAGDTIYQNPDDPKAREQIQLSGYFPFNASCTPGSGQCLEDEDFAVWMRIAAFPTFKKLHRLLPDGLDKGDYTVMIANMDMTTGEYSKQLYPVNKFGGSKNIVVSTTCWLGGKNSAQVIGLVNIVVGVVCLILALAFFVKHSRASRPPATQSYIREHLKKMLE